MVKRAPRQDEAAFVQLNDRFKPAGVCLRTDEDEECPCPEGPAGARAVVLDQDPLQAVLSQQFPDLSVRVAVKLSLKGPALMPSRFFLCILQELREAAGPGFEPGLSDSESPRDCCRDLRGRANLAYSRRFLFPALHTFASYCARGVVWMVSTGVRIAYS
jgi:hypothetical protein